MDVELSADLNNEDDDGLCWTLISKAKDPAQVTVGAVLRAGSIDEWSWVRVVAIDPDGQVHFELIDASEAEAGGELASAS